MPSASNGSRNGRRSSTRPGEAAPAAAPRARSSVGVRPNTSRSVSLNWRTLENPAAYATSVTDSPGERERTRSELLGEHPRHVPRRVAEEIGEPADARPLHDAVPDESHRTRGESALDVPLGAPRHGLGEAAL